METVKKRTHASDLDVNLDNEEKLSIEHEPNAMEQAGFVECIEKKERVYASYSDVVKDFIEEVEAPTHEFDVYVYRLTPGKGNLGKKLINKLINEVPDPHQVGLEHGAGRYQFYISGIYDKNNKRRSFTKEINLDSCYDDYQKEYSLKQKQNLTAVPINGVVGTIAPNGIEQMQLSMAIIERMMSTFAPLMESKYANQNSGVGMDMEMFGGMYKKMGNVMAQNMIDAQSMMNDQLRVNNNLPGVVDDPEEASGVIAVIEKVMPMLSSIVPLILQPKMVSQPLVNQIKKNPDYQRIVNDNKKLSIALKKLEEVHGSKKVNEVLTKLEVKRPMQKETSLNFVKPVIKQSLSK